MVGPYPYRVRPSVCPRCGSSAQVRTARELFDMMNGAQAQAYDYNRTIDDPLEEIGGALFGAGRGFAGRVIGRRLKKAFDEKVIPAMEARAAQMQQELAQSAAEQEVIVARYPGLRGCMADEVIFLDGGTRTVAVSEITMPVTLAQADSIVARLR